jgi:antirestriction protein ArdC
MRAKTSAGNGRPNLYREVTGKIIELLKDHQLKWERPWIVVKDNSLPHNASTGRAYSGVNIILLSFEMMLRQDFRSGWITFPQVSKVGGKVKRGQKASQIYFTDRIFIDKTNKKWKPDEVKDMTREQRKELGLKTVPFLVRYNVFNVVPTEGLPEKFYERPEDKLTPNIFEMNHEAEKLMIHSGASILEGRTEQAYYSPLEDIIYLPARGRFHAEHPFYGTALHELAHWTGHPARLNRFDSNAGGQNDTKYASKYAFEELVAELTSAYLCAELGFSKLITSNAAYIKSWLKALESDVKLVFRASRQAMQARQFIKDAVAKSVSGM